MKLYKTHFINEIPRTSLQKPKRFMLKKLAIDERNGIKPAVKASASDKETAGLIEIVARIANVPVDCVDESTKIFSELAMDSLSAVDLAMEIEGVAHEFMAL